jgi:amino acid adenylation domain-containing protein
MSNSSSSSEARVRTAPHLGELLEGNDCQTSISPAIGYSPDGPSILVGARIERIARDEPNRIALSAGNSTCTYGEMNARANCLARRLLARGLRPEEPVAVWCDSNYDAIPAILAVLKAGGAYLPLDPQLPPDRVRFVLQDAGLRWMLAMTSSQPPVADPQIDVLAMEGPASISAEEGADLTIDVRASDLAYLIYTSGSSGAPKGVLATHANLNYSTTERIAYYGEPACRFLLLSPLWFDSSIAGIFWTLTTGGTLVLPTGLVPGDLAAIAQRIAADRITHLLCIPALWRTVLGQIEVHDRQPFAALRQVIVAGEACSPAIAQLHSRLLPGVRLFNEYGPTEASVWCTVHEITGRDREAVPIGKPLRGTRIHILDDELRPVAPGVAGELFVDGPGVTRGYLNRPGETSARFLPNPFAGGSTRIYRTGDLGRLRRDGTIEFLGRRDAQVKIRGHRVELTEIEAALVAHPAVLEATAVVKPCGAAGTQVIALVVPASTKDFSEAELRQHLLRKLPPYMSPARYIPLPSLPRNGNGKIDRQRCAQFCADQNSGSANGSARPRSVSPALASEPRNALEHELCRLWTEMLGREIGIRDEFFQVGGDSLAAIDLLTRIENRFGQRPPAAWIFNGPTVESLAHWLQTQRATDAWSPLVALQPQGTRPPLFCVHPGGGNVFCYLHLARCLGSDQPLFGLEASGIDGRRATVPTIPAMADEYLRAVRQACPAGPYLLAGWSFGGLVAYEMAWRLGAAGQHVGLLAILDAGILYSLDILRAIFSDKQMPWFQALTCDPQPFLAEFLEKAVPAGIVPPNLAPVDAARFLDVFIANLKATLDYRPKPYDGAATLFVAREAQCRPKHDPFVEWQRCCSHVERRIVPGNHISMLQLPQVETLATQLGQLIAEVADSGPAAIRDNEDGDCRP